MKVATPTMRPQPAPVVTSTMYVKVYCMGTLKNGRPCFWSIQVDSERFTGGLKITCPKCYKETVYQ